ncbi:enterochelin esterase-like enzyme [Paenibacillus anaericanus]|uniref:alpha/beta hydrolase n=1 Tax=Paenibacillus anaericanus TaxID=170367 RepID=UPI00277DCA26|nr:alpha/beta hydrolase-fold protein [Paenibacillus anaericanus]MDQ0090982.1 enterochelin esterase-like enzyme [Paenibacillus anaericanus]
MNKSFIVMSLFIFLMISGCGTIAPKNSVVPSKIDDIEIISRALKKTMRFAVYLPPDYDADKRYPVLYALYGFGGTRNYFFNPMGLDQVADRLISENKIAPLIIVSPDYGNSFAVNTIPGQGVKPGAVDEGNYEDYLIDEVIPYVDTHYSTEISRDSRFVGGFSMGGYAALFLGFTHTDLFSKVGGHSAAIWDFTSQDYYTDQRDWLYPNEELRNQRDPFRLAASKDLKNTQVYLDVGEADGLALVDEKLYNLLKSIDIPVEWHINPGGHSTSYWIAHFEDYLTFYSGR